MRHGLASPHREVRLGLGLTSREVRPTVAEHALSPHDELDYAAINQGESIHPSIDRQPFMMYVCVVLLFVSTFADDTCHCTIMGTDDDDACHLQ